MTATDDGISGTRFDRPAAVMRQIFSLTLEGFGPYQISQLLTKQGIEIPAVHMARHAEGVNKSKTFKDPCGWGSSTIAHILKKREYLGHTVNFKTRKHFKDKKSHYAGENEWTVFENTHEPIIDQLEKLICKIYEDNALGTLPDSRYAALDAQYAKEQGELADEITELEKAIGGF